ncbi:hybrid sensor histidine kinase/response regulator [Bosea sp. (in: a-proteobacteria)]|uniref:ATP-binding response regulator n=1 Tax=Bosea sp. (in: a-proteobacteria) TaxID=1871050 RepID=UPI00261FEE59|nr:hybrid sensor histidine kinase/response regulator [Bosea sp. (in: a-proteobacteria)]MCO5093595.1 hybrid sensor histidine kinase/response regulator [Bosea sp. (in: a-proteobacteria)]
MVAPHWRLDYLSSIGTASWLIHLCVAVLAGIELFRAGAGAWVPAWTAAIVLVSMAMIALGLLYRHGAAWPRPSAFAQAHSLLTGLTGLGWGVGALLCATSSPPDLLNFYTLVLGGIALGAVSALHVMVRSCLISVWTSLPLLAMSWLLHGRDVGPESTAAMIMLFAVMLTVLGLRMNGFVGQNVRLTEELAAKHAILTRTGAQLAEAHEEKSRFLAQASHDLRQPIHAIGLFVEYLGGLRLSRNGREVLANIDRSLDSLTRLCRSLLDLSALDVGRVRPQIGAVPLGEVLGEVARQATEAARARGVRLRYRPSRLWVLGDAALLHTMVQNLVSNAIKYAPGAQVVIGARRRAGGVAVIVLDTGPGIAHADQKRIFQEFVRLHTPGTEEMEGLGLGLSIVKRLADMMGLRIALTSHPGKGTCFAIEGLRETAAGEFKARRQPAALARRLQGVRVLVIDDDRLVRNGTAQLLTRWGCHVQASDRYDAHAARNCDFLLCDQELADGKTGLEVIRAARREAGAALPAALVTGGRTDHIAETCKDEAIVLLTKPVRPAQLRSALLAGVLAQTRPSSVAIAAAAERDETSRTRSSPDT